MSVRALLVAQICCQPHMTDCIILIIITNNRILVDRYGMAQSYASDDGGNGTSPPHVMTLTKLVAHVKAQDTIIGCTQ